MTIPDDPAQLGSWFETAIVTGQVHQLANDLRVINRRVIEETDTLDAYQPYLEKAETEGLATFPLLCTKRLLTHPTELESLAEHLLINGGSYWTKQINNAAPHRESVADGWRRLNAAIPELAKGTVTPASKPNVTRWVALAATVATAAVIMLAVWLNTGSNAWGWQNPNAYRETASREAYLNQLADSADEWYKKRPNDSQGLARRIREFRAGCDQLLAAQHSSIREDDREWLRKRCLVWRKNLDEQLAKLANTPTADPLAIRNDVDTIVTNLTKAIRTLASS